MLHLLADAANYGRLKSGCWSAVQEPLIPVPQIPVSGSLALTIRRVVIWWGRAVGVPPVVIALDPLVEPTWATSEGLDAKASQAPREPLTMYRKRD